MNTIGHILYDHKTETLNDYSVEIKITKAMTKMYLENSQIIKE
jgi:hypothetical protein